MKMLFYKADKGRLLDKLIAYWTKGEYSHVELLLNNGYCYSSSSRDKGVRRKIIEDYNVSGKWDIFDIDIDENIVLEFYEQTKDLKYDWLGILFSEFINFNVQSKEKWYCSEWIAEILNINSGGFILKTNISPNRLYGYLLNKELIR